MGKIQLIAEEEFNSVISKGMVLVDFYADWCGPCRMLTPVLEKLQDDQQERISIVKIDIDKAQEIAQQYGISSIPTLLFFKSGQLIKQVVGLKTFEELKQIIEQIAS